MKSEDLNKLNSISHIIKNNINPLSKILDAEKKFKNMTTMKDILTSRETLTGKIGHISKLANSNTGLMNNLSMVDRFSKSFQRIDSFQNSYSLRNNFVHQFQQSFINSERDLISRSLTHNPFINGSFAFDDYLSEIDEEIEEPEIREKSQLILLDDTIRIQGLIKSVYNDNEELYRVHHRDFECLITELLASKGLMVELTKATRDDGIDIIAIEDNEISKNKYIVECKRYSKDNAVGIGVVRNLMYTVDKYKANKGIIFTSSYFSADVYKERVVEKLEYKLGLKDGMEILEWINYYIKQKSIK